MIEIYKIMCDKENCFLPLTVYRHTVKVIGKKCRTDKRHIINLWNLHLWNVVMTTRLDGCKRGLDKFMDGKAISYH